MLAIDPRVERVGKLMAVASQALVQGQPAQALMAVRQALALRPSEAKAHRLVGQIYERMGKPVLARQAYETAASLDPALASPDSADQASAVTEAAPAAVPPVSGTTAQPAPDQEWDEQDEEPEELDPAQQRLVLEMAMQCLTQMANVEALFRQKGQQDSEAFHVVHDTRTELGEQVKEVREAWRAHQLAQETPAEPEIPATHYEGLGPFTHTLGTGTGAMSQGKEVADLQEVLTLEGLHVPLTGKFDTSTSLALRKFQEKYHLTQRNGVVGGETRKLLNRLVGQSV